MRGTDRMPPIPADKMTAEQKKAAEDSRPGAATRCAGPSL